MIQLDCLKGEESFFYGIFLNSTSSQSDNVEFMGQYNGYSFNATLDTFESQVPVGDLFTNIGYKTGCLVGVSYAYVFVIYICNMKVLYCIIYKHN